MVQKSYLICILSVATIIFTVQADLTPKTWNVNLDAAPENRWPWQQMASVYNASLIAAEKMIDVFIPQQYQPVLLEIAPYILPNLGDYGKEIESMTKAAGMDLSKGIILNLIYEMEAACTSIVGCDSQGNIFHGRNLDFVIASTLRSLAINVNFQRNGKTVYHGTTYAGYVGLLTGMRPGAYSISLNQRNVDRDPVYNLIEALFYPNSYVAAFLIRDTLQNTALSFSDAVKILHESALIAPCYVTVGGSKIGEGAVITRDRNGGDLWKLDLNKENDGGWFLVQTNDDHWKPPADSRRDTAIKGMIKIGRDNLNLNGLFVVLSTPQVLNSGTTYTTLMSSASDSYNTTVRFLN